MVGESPEEAIAAFLQRLGSTLRCITPATTVASPPIPGRPRSVTLYAAGQEEPGRLRLQTHGGQGALIFGFAHTFRTEPVVQNRARGWYEVSSSFYQYQVLDLADNEIVIYDWHPTGTSAVTTPHVHVPAAGSAVLQQRAGSRLIGQKTHLGEIHLPTGQILLEDIVELLIREFSVDPLRPDWEAILSANRAASERD